MFCPKCGSILTPRKQQGKTVIACSCGYRSGETEIKLKTEKKEHRDMEVVEAVPETSPLTDENCPKCGHTKAYYKEVQMRAADEAPSVFYKCAKCGRIWKQR